MSKEQLISSNTFTGGMNQDMLPSLSDSKTYWMAYNAVNSNRESKHYGITNEGSNFLSASTGKDVVGTAYVEERNWTIVFKKDNSLHLFNHGDSSIKEIMKSSDFGCDWNFSDCEWIGNNVEFKSMEPCGELYVYFTARSQAYKVNLDLMLDADRKAGLIRELSCDTKCGLVDNCEYFKVSKQGCAPTINVHVVNNGGVGGNLLAGAYTFTCRLKHTDGGETNTFHFSRPAMVGSEHNVAGEETSAYVEVNLSGLDCKFAEIELFVIENIGGIITAKTLNTFNYGNNTFSYRYNGTDGTPIDIRELLVNSNVHIEPKHLKQKDGHMLYYGLKSQRNIHMQPYANAIETEYVVYEISYADVMKYNIRSLMRGETYAFGIVPNYIDGSHGKTFHIPSTPAGFTPGDQTSNVLDNIVDQENDNADLNEDGSFSFGSTRNKVSANYNSLVEACKYYKSGTTVSVLFDCKIVAGGDDTLTLQVNGDSTKTDLLSCIKRSIKDNKETIISIIGSSAVFNAHSISGHTGNTLTLSGKSSTTLSGEAVSISVLNTGSDIATAFASEAEGGTQPSASGSAQSQSGLASASLSTSQEVERKRTPIDDSPGNPQNDHYDDIMEDVIDSMSTNAAEDVCEQVLLWEEHLRAHCCWCYGDRTICPGDDFTPIYAGQAPAEVCDSPLQTCCGSGDGCDSGTAKDLCDADMGDLEKSYASWQDLIASYTEDELEPDYTSNNIHEGAKKVAELIKKRERKNRKKKAYSISKSVSYGSGSVASANSGGVSLAGPFFDADGINELGIDIVEVSSGKTEPDFEKDIKYPCNTDCNGDFIYGGLAGKPVAHHKFPDASKEPHYISKSFGVPNGTYWPDASETKDLYIRILGVRFNNIQLPPESELPIPLCPNNPYSIVMVKRTEKNKKVLIKGLATGTFRITNNGKSYDHPRYGTNSLEEVSLYHDDGEGNRLSNQGSGSSHTMYSLDGLTTRPSLNADRVVEELRVSGEGERYGLYSKGTEPEDSIKGRRIDAMGARSSVNLHQWVQSGTSSGLSFKQYVEGNDSFPPGAGGDTPLMNKSGQPAIWFGSGLSQLTDESFTGDVLNYNVPIAFAQGQYVSFRADLDNQYGNLENLNYIPLLHAGKKHGSTIEGPVGDTYIGPYSFVKTGVVSDKVGSCIEDEKFNIPAQVPIKKKKRCICDGPEDVIKQLNGQFVWQTLPEEGDAADPKNWAGTHTVIGSRTQPYTEAVGTKAISDFYFPGTTTTNITYVGEFETCPWLREKSDLLEKQWYPEIKKPDYRFDSGVSVDGDTNGWEDAYLPQFHREIEQPSLWQRLLKALIRTVLVTIFPMIGAVEAADIANGGIDIVWKLAEFPLLGAFWWLMNQVLFDNATLDKIVGIPVCKSDEVGGFPEGSVKGLFFNPSGYNVDYSTMSDIYTYEGMPDPYYVCDCEDRTSSEIFISDRQYQDSIFDAYTHIRPLSKIHISSSYGPLTNLFIVGGDLYAHTTDAIIPLRRNRAAVASDIGEILLGSGGFLLEPEGVLTEGIPEGFAGLKRHNEAISTHYGYFFVDSEADIIYRFTSSKGLEAISNKGMFNFFKEKLNFCDITDCIDERVTNTAYYALGVDPRLNRLLVTKSDGDNSFTISYDLEGEFWVSFHSYIPRAYIWDRRDMYTLDDEGIWKHNEDCSFQTFYGKYKPHMIEFAAVNRSMDTFLWNNMILNTEAQKCSGCSWVNDIDKTFSKMAMWNSTQGTGTLDIEWRGDNKGANENAYKLAKDSSNAVANKRRRLWRINNLKDFRRDDCRAEPMTTCVKCQPIHDINEGIFDCSSVNIQNYENKIIADRFTKYRFIYDDDNKTRLNTIYINTNGKQTEI